MGVYKDNKTNTWRVIYRYTDWTGEQKQSSRRGFASKHEAQAWEREQMNKVTADLDMSFASFVEHYTEDLKTRMAETRLRNGTCPVCSRAFENPWLPQNVSAYQQAQCFRLQMLRESRRNL